MAQNNFEYCNRLLIHPELSAGVYDDKGQVMLQLRAKLKEAEKPLLEVEIDPATRYAPLAAEFEARWRNMSQEERRDKVHPRVSKVLAIMEYCKDREQNGTFLYEGKEP